MLKQLKQQQTNIKIGLLLLLLLFTLNKQILYFC
jgi:hypothetical protein